MNTCLAKDVRTVLMSRKEILMALVGNIFDKFVHELKRYPNSSSFA